LSGKVIRWCSLIRNLCECGGERLVLAFYFLLYLVHILMLKSRRHHQQDEEAMARLAAMRPLSLSLLVMRPLSLS
jgi:hypothetical protein